MTRPRRRQLVEPQSSRDAGKYGRAGRGATPETPIEQERRHIAAFQRIIEKQEAIIKRLDALGDARGAAQARELLASFNQALALALERLERLLQSK